MSTDVISVSGGGSVVSGDGCVASDATVSSTGNFSELATEAFGGLAAMSVEGTTVGEGRTAVWIRTDDETVEGPASGDQVDGIDEHESEDDDLSLDDLLLLDEYQKDKIVSYVRAHRAEWDSIGKDALDEDGATGEQYLTIRRTGDEEGDLSRTVLYYPDRYGAGNWEVIVLLNRNDEAIVGSGFFKKVKLAYEMRSGNLFAEAISRDVDCDNQVDSDNIRLAWRELKYMLYLQDGYEHGSSARGLLPIVGSRCWDSKNSHPADDSRYIKKISIRTPLYDMDLQKAIEGGLTKEDKIKVAKDLLHGLWAMRDKEIVHRDIKPQNVLIRRNNNGEIEAVIHDFGLACETNLECTRVADIGSPDVKGGTSTYWAPEYEERSHKLGFCLCMHGPETVTFDIQTDYMKVVTTYAIDTYAMGVVFGELFDESELDEMEDEVKSAFLDMVSKSPGDRPNPAAVLAILEEVYPDSEEVSEEVE